MAVKKKSQASRLGAALAAALLLPMASAHALGLWQAYEAALQNDPAYRGAKFERAAGQENKEIGRSSLLPVISASFSKVKNRTDYLQASPDPRFPDQQTHPLYTSVNSAINLRQPVVNFEGIARFKQGVAQAKAGDANFDSRAQDLKLRLVSAYFDVLFAADQLALMTAQRDTYLEQKRVNDRTFAKGEGTRTDMLETQAKLDVAEAQVIEARDNLASTKDMLASIVGMNVNSIDGLSKEFTVKPLQPASFEAWVALAEEKNPDLLAQKYSIEASLQEVNRNRAGHKPRLDFVAGFSKGQAEAINTPNTGSTIRSLGFQLSIPIYSGGYVDATTNQAVANAERAKTDYEVRKDKIMQELRKSYSQVQSSVGKIDAYQKAVDSGRLLIQATQQSIKGGVRINLDLLNARQQFYASQRDLAQAKYNYLLSYLRLRINAGVLDDDDIRKLAGYFVASK